MGKNWLYYVIIAKKHRFWLKVKPKSNHKLKNYKKCPSLVGEACEDKPNLRLYGQTLNKIESIDPKNKFLVANLPYVTKMLEEKK